MRGLIAAIAFMTRLPVPAARLTQADFATAIRWFPAAGVPVGLAVAGAAWAGSMIDSWTAALVALVMWVAVTGALHLDGLGDIADAAGAAHKGRDRLLDVLADPHLGSFGTVAIILQLMAKLVLLHALVEAGSWLVLLAVPAIARLGPLVWTIWLPQLHAGLASRFRAGVHWGVVALWAAPLLALGWWWPAMLTAPLLFALWGCWLRTRIGGISGDGHGAGIELCESALLFLLLVQERLS